MRLAAVLLLGLLALGAAPRSGQETMAPALQAMQADDLANPGMLWVAEGEALFQRQGCASCHTRASLRGAATRYPAWDAAHQRPVNLAGQISQCREARLGLPPQAEEAPELLALTAYVANLSRGLSLQPSADPALAPARQRGEALFRQRRGQLNLSCAQCHEDNAGRHLSGALIPEGHSNGYPLYRLEWQALGTLQRRLRNCLAGVRSEPPPPGAVEYLELEVFLASRAKGLAVETPAVRP